MVLRHAWTDVTYDIIVQVLGILGVFKLISTYSLRTWPTDYEFVQPATTASHVHHEHYIRYVVDIIRTLQAVVIIAGVMGSLAVLEKLPSSMLIAATISSTYIFFASVRLITNTTRVKQSIITMVYAIVLLIYTQDMYDRRRYK